MDEVQFVRVLRDMLIISGRADSVVMHDDDDLETPLAHNECIVDGRFRIVVEPVSSKR